jgi:mycofactocin system glycosyltransferase
MTRVVLDDRVRRYDGGRVLVGGAGRIVRLTAAGAAALDAPPPALARRLIDAGLAHPVPARVEHPDATIVIPVRDRAEELDRCLAALGVSAGGAIAVDDGSRDPAAIAGVCARWGTRLVRRDVPGGPGAARNSALAHLQTELVAFLDSDCVASPDWVRELAGHFGDPRVAAVAPRVRDPALDMGPSAAAVAPGARVAYVPSAALIVRRAALGAFDETLRYGEDVDLVWRLHDRGWQVRYDPRVEIAHVRQRAGGRRRAVARRPAAFDRDLLVRRYRYGTSAAPLAQRHPGRLAPFVIAPGPAAVLVLLAARRPKAAAAVFAAQTALLARTLRARGVPARLAPTLTIRAVIATAKGVAGGHPAYRAGVIAGAIRYRTAAPLTPQLKLARPAAIRSAPRR